MDARLRAAKLAWTQSPDDPAAWAAYRRALEQADQLWQVAGCEQVGPYRLRDVLTGYRQPTKRAQWVSWSDDRRLALLEDELWDMQRLRRLWTPWPSPQDAYMTALSPDGALIAAVKESDVWVWSVRDGQVVLHQTVDSFSGRLQGAFQLEHVVDDRLLLACWGSRYVAFLSLRTGQVERIETSDATGGVNVGSLHGALSAQRDIWAWVHPHDFQVRCWNLRTGAQLGPFDSKAFHWPMASALSPDGDEVALLHEELRVTRLRATDGAVLADRVVADHNLLGAAGLDSSLAYAPDGSLWIHALPRQQVLVLDRDTLDLRAQRQLPHHTSVSLVPTAGRAWTSAGWLRLHDGGLVLEPFPDAHGEPVLGVTAADPQTVVSVSATGAPKRWRLHERRAPTRDTERDDAPLGATDAYLQKQHPTLPDPTALVTTSHRGTLLARSVAHLTEVYRDGVGVARRQRPFHGDSLVIRDDGLQAEYAPEPDRLQLVRADVSETHPLPNFCWGGLAFSPRGGVLLSANPQHAAAWRTPTHGPLTLDPLWDVTLDGLVAPTAKIHTAVCEQPHTWALACGDVLAGFAWNQSTPTWQHPIPTPLDLRYEHDGRLRLLCADGLRWFDADGHLLDLLPVDLSRSGDALRSVALSPDASRLVLGTEAGAVLLYERET